MPRDQTSFRTPSGLARLPVALAALLTFTSLLLTGCFDTKQEITLNPDGSGKIVIESVFQQIAPFLNNVVERAALQNVTNAVQSLVEESEGIEAWRDITFHQREDGKAFFRGTAYFRSLTKLKIALGGDQRFSATIDPSGTLTISRLSTPTPDIPITKPAEPVTMESIQRERAQFRALKPALQTTIGEMRLDTTILFPGTLLRASIFETNAPRTLRLLLDGRKWLAALEARAFDTSLDARRIAGEKFSPDDDEMMRMIYGHPGPILAVIKPGTAPLFDYAKEVAEAQRRFPELARQLHPVTPPEAPPKPAVNGHPATLQVIGVEWFTENSPSWNYSFSGDRRRGYTLHLKAELSGIVLRTEQVQFTRAATLEGLDLLPPRHTANLSASPSTSKDGASVTFRAILQTPPADSRGIAELSGVLECAGMASQRTMDLVSGRLRAGTQGTEFDTRIDGYDPRLSGMDRLSLRTRLKPEQIRAIRVVGDAGQRCNLEQRGHTILDDMHVITYVSRTEIPSTGRIVAEVLTGEQTLRIPFALTNVTLLGQPLR